MITSRTAMTKTRLYVLLPLLTLLARADFSQLPLQFEANRGQGPAGAAFVSRGHGFGLALSATQATFSLGGVPVKMMIAGGNPAALGHGEQMLPGRANYFTGGDPKHWRTGVETYRQVRFTQVYPGIDLVYYGKQGELEYDFVVHPGADPSTIALQFDGVVAVRIGDGGDLILDSGEGQIRHKAPVIYQEFDGKRAKVLGGYRMLAGGRVGFRLRDYDRTRTLVIDPTLLFATFYGGQIRETATSVAVDRQGNVYVAGQATSLD